MKNKYVLLPFQFAELDSHKKTLLINDVGDYTLLPNDRFISLVNGSHPTDSDEFKDLLLKFVSLPEYLASTIDLLAIRYRTRKRFLYNFTTLHMIVLTKRCNQKCHYCHASSLNREAGPAVDMNLETAKKCIDFILSMPTTSIKIEFQGGEPTLNGDILEACVEYALEKNLLYKKHIEFVVCTNLFSISDKTLSFFKSNNIRISTSFDGPERIHNKHRVTFDGGGTYSQVYENIERAKEAIGNRNISALMTATRDNLPDLPEIVDEYQRIGFSSIFIRPLNPFGFAHEKWDILGYSASEFNSAYAKVIDYLIQINKKGLFFPELYASILLSRILTPYSTGFVDLQSPAGTGIQGVIYDTNGDILVSDEARMYRNMTGSNHFTIGNVFKNEWNEVFGSSKLRKIIRNSCIESLPYCSWCVYQPYCGSDPVRDFAQFGKSFIWKIKTDFCKRQKAIFEMYLNLLLKNDPETIDVLWSWVNNKPLSNRVPIQ